MAETCKGCECQENPVSDDPCCGYQRLADVRPDNFKEKVKVPLSGREWGNLNSLVGLSRDESNRFAFRKGDQNGQYREYLRLKPLIEVSKGLCDWMYDYNVNGVEFAKLRKLLKKIEEFTPEPL